MSHQVRPRRRRWRRLLLQRRLRLRQPPRLRHCLRRLHRLYRRLRPERRPWLLRRQRLPQRAGRLGLMWRGLRQPPGLARETRWCGQRRESRPPQLTREHCHQALLTSGELQLVWGRYQMRLMAHRGPRLRQPRLRRAPPMLRRAPLVLRRAPLMLGMAPLVLRRALLVLQRAPPVLRGAPPREELRRTLLFLRRAQLRGALPVGVLWARQHHRRQRQQRGAQQLRRTTSPAAPPLRLRSLRLVRGRSRQQLAWQSAAPPVGKAMWRRGASPPVLGHPCSGRSLGLQQ
jgi:hypothetical protein